jgi:hypothetical protein
LSVAEAEASGGAEESTTTNDAAASTPDDDDDDDSDGAEPEHSDAEEGDAGMEEDPADGN